MENQVQEQQVAQEVQQSSAPEVQQQVQETQQAAPQEVQQEQQQAQQESSDMTSSWKIKSLNSEADIYSNRYEDEQQEEYQTEQQVEETPVNDVLKLVPENQQATAETAEATQSQAEEFDPFEKLGVKDDAYFKKLYEAYKNDALDEFLITTHTDYDAISDADILRMQIDSQYKNLSDDDRDLIFQMKLQKDFNISDLNSEDSRAGKLMMRLEADKIREGLKEQQAAYQPTARPNEVEQFNKQI